MTVNDESLEGLLKRADRTAGPPPSETPNLAAGVRRRYDRWQQRRRHVRRGGAMFACYAAGLLTMWGWTEAVEPQARPEAQRGVNRQVKSRSAAGLSSERDSDGEPNGRTANDPEPGPGVERPSPDSAYTRLRRLGDEYLLKKGKVSIALKLYSRALEAASEDELEVAHNDDSWLLISLKKDRLVSGL